MFLKGETMFSVRAHSRPFRYLHKLPVVIAMCLMASGCTSERPIQIGSQYGPQNTLVPESPSGHGFAIGENTIADIASEAMKSVVNIDTRTDVTVPDYGIRLFEMYGEQPMMPRQSKLEIQGIGTGVIIRSDGLILTNYHVVKEANTISVTLNDKRVLNGQVIGRDSFSDLALIKVPATNLPAARLGSSKNLRPGQFAIAIGSPAGLSNTVTFGIISAIGRTLGEVGGDVGLVQTDAAINPGNSGGPLLNMHGEVVAINTAIRKDYQNIGFGIPMDTAKQVTEQLLAHGSVQHPYLGIAMQDLNDQVDAALGLPVGTRGIVIAKVTGGSPADNAGLQAGDVISKVDNQTVNSAKDVQQIVRSHKPGDNLSLQVLRAGNSVQVNLTVGEYPAQSSG